ncbi:hypothetical protein Q4610_11665 [Sphingobium sp. HBC34]|uniref:Uncharacterized protein n=1 Tax=Sphingobium cyanobacteriorum TaxID=3063954 RepID=A0ABT8ZMD1_9SPHN|nr:hypothetical protein [Sphingobium sp. HBC34]MDO7835699.1 hypothetical protein [Sphingobium sp. HBC34]
MSGNILEELAQMLESKGLPPSYIGRTTPLGHGIFGRRVTPAANALLGYDEQTSARVASIASRGLQAPESLTLSEIKSVCASALTQTQNHT